MKQLRGETDRKPLYALIAAVVIFAVALVGVIVWQGTKSAQEATAGPQGATSDGGFVKSVRKQNADDTEPPNANKDAPRVIKYIDLQCPGCKQMEAKTSYGLGELAYQGKIQVEYRVVSFLDKMSTNKYSSRAANAAACVAEKAPDKYGDYVTLLLSAQTSEGAAGHENNVLEFYANSLGVNDSKSCIDSGKWNKWVEYNTDRANLTSTPTVYFNDDKLDAQQDIIAQVNKKLEEQK